MRKTFLVATLLLAVAASGAVAADEALTDDFSKVVPGRWKVVTGDWKVGGGVMAHTGKGNANHDRIIADFPFTEGTIEVTAVPRKKNRYKWASVGIVIKRLDEKRDIWFRFGSYGTINIDGHGPKGFDRIELGRSRPELGRKYRLTVIVRNGLIYVCVDDIMIGVVRDPFAGKAGRAGLFSESGSEFDDFKVTRVSR